jgi:SAM-dependent methyltransferase
LTQNIYDDEAFFEAYARLPRSVQGLDGAPEWSTLRALLPAIEGRRVLDLGCGFGWFCRWAREHGATAVLGVDVSERMLARARGPRSTDWLAPGVIKQHRTIATYVNLLIGEGLAISHLDEWGPSADQVASHPEWANERQRPLFLLVACRR